MNVTAQSTTSAAMAGSPPALVRPGVTRLGWVGTGVMGRSMVGRLRDAGFDILLTTRSRSKAEPLLERGCRWADSPATVTVALGELPAVLSRGWWIFKTRTCARCRRTLKREPSCLSCSSELNSAANAVRHHHVGNGRHAVRAQRAGTHVFHAKRSGERHVCRALERFAPRAKRGEHRARVQPVLLL